MGVELGAREIEEEEEPNKNQPQEESGDDRKTRTRSISSNAAVREESDLNDNDHSSNNSNNNNANANNTNTEQDEVASSDATAQPDNNNRVITALEEDNICRPTIKQVLVWRPSFSNPFVRSNQSTNNKEAGVETLYEAYPELRKMSSSFDEFGTSVYQDVAEKIKGLQDFKDLETSNRSDRNYANVQIFMLRKYLRRISNFQDKLHLSLGTIQESLDEGSAATTEAKVDQHFLLVGKLKTRLKHILDVSEKYAAIDPLAVAINRSLDDIDGPEVWSQSPRLMSRSMEVLNPGEKSMSTSSLPFPSSTLPFPSGAKPSSFSASHLPSPSNRPLPPPSHLPLSASNLPSPSSSQSSTTASIGEVNSNNTSPVQDPYQNHRRPTIANLFRARAASTGPPSIQIDGPTMVPSLDPGSTGRLSITPTPPSSPDSGHHLGGGGGGGDGSPADAGGMRKRASSFQSITEHLTVLRKTYSNKR